MSTFASSLLSLILAMPVAPLQAVVTPVPIAIAEPQWQPEPGDRIFVDTRDNFGYLVHSDGRYLPFPVATGQRRHVYYIGRSYNAATPNWDWTIRSMDTKGDRVTFGPTGRFLRLYKDGEENTAYGFHEHRDEAEFFATDAPERYRSMGCIIVQHDMMNLLVLTFELNGSVDVTTAYGIDDINGRILAANKTAEEKL